jgi:hypothetical protein
LRNAKAAPPDGGNRFPGMAESTVEHVALAGSW